MSRDRALASDLVKTGYVAHQFLGGSSYLGEAAHLSADLKT